jgi:hypothetical protein
VINDITPTEPATAIGFLRDKVVSLYETLNDTVNTHMNRDKRSSVSSPPSEKVETELDAPNVTGQVLDEQE